MGEKRGQNEIVGWNHQLYITCSESRLPPEGARPPAGLEEVESEQFAEVSSLFTTVRHECNILTHTKFEYRECQVYMHIIFEEIGHALDLPLISNREYTVITSANV